MFKTLLIFLIILGLDQASKWWAQQAGLVVLNPGISFGFLAIAPEWVLPALGVLFLAVLGWFCRSFWRKNYLAAAFFFAGAFSNILDRLWWGGVRDWLPIPLVHLSNNLADWTLFISLLWVGILELPRKNKIYE